MGSYKSSTEEESLDTSLVWLYGMLLVTGINLCSLFGVVLYPFSKKSWYKSLLLFMVANAVGVLSGSSLLFLLSGAIGVSEFEWDERKHYLERITILLTSVFVFYNFEQLVKLVLEAIERKRQAKRKAAAAKKVENENSAGEYRLEERNKALANNDSSSDDIEQVSFQALAVDHSSHHHRNHALEQAGDLLHEQTRGSEESGSSDSTNSNDNKTNDDNKKGFFKNLVTSFVHVQPVAWMVIFGDAIHNFVDGLSIGAGMARSLPDGLSISIAILAEELPHELGDFAVLLKAGLPVGGAMLLNFFSACMCYIGFAVGVVLGESEEANTVIFALAAGLFLYISLTDLLPELSPDTAEDSSAKNHGHSHNIGTVSDEDNKGSIVWARIRHMLVVDSGMIIGYAMMVVLAIYSEDIVIATGSGEHQTTPDNSTTALPTSPSELLN